MSDLNSIRADFNCNELQSMVEESEENNGAKKELSDLSDFVGWVNSAESGIKLSGVELRDCGPRIGFGIFATRSIRWNEKIMEIPKRLIITANVVAEIAEYYVFLKRSTSASPFSAFETLALFFYLEEWYRRHFCGGAPELIEHILGRLVVNDSCQQLSSLSNEGADNSVDGKHNTQFKPHFNTALMEFYRLRECLTQRKAGDGRSWLDASRCDRWFNAYLSVLPRRFDTAVAEAFAIVSDITEAKSNVERIAGQLPLTARQHFRKQVAEFEALYGKMKATLDDQLDLALLLWAWHIVNTRCIWVDIAELLDSYGMKFGEHMGEKHRIKEADAESASDDCIAIIPMLDMFNHRPNAQCFAAYDRRSATYCVETRTSAAAEGTELFVCYGPHDNARLWLEYGFQLETSATENNCDVDSENVFNRVDFSIDLFIMLVHQWIKNNSVKTPPQWRFTAEHERTLRDASLPCTLYASDVSPSYGLKANCKIALLSVQQLKDWRRVVFMESDSGDSEMDEKYELAEEIEMTVADRLLYAILTELRRQLTAKMERTVREERFRLFWMDQIRILDQFLGVK